MCQPLLPDLSVASGLVGGGFICAGSRGYRFNTDPDMYRISTADASGTVEMPLLLS